MAADAGFDPAVVSLRERKKQQTRQRLADAALRLFDEQGYEATSVDDIARAADFSAMTFFRHFPTKEDVAFSDQSGLVDAFRDVLDREHIDDPWETIHKASLANVSQLIDSDPESARIRATLWHNVPAVMRRYSEIWQHWEEIVALVLAKGSGQDVDEDIYPRTAASAVVGALRTAVRKHHLHGGTAIDYAAQGLDMVRPIVQGPLLGEPRRRAS
ncbi:MAG TPA: TetR/AcrR family transcriptional regulator [Pseudonocardia sp.]